MTPINHSTSIWPPAATTLCCNVIRTALKASSIVLIALFVAVTCVSLVGPAIGLLIGGGVALIIIGSRCCCLPVFNRYDNGPPIIPRRVHPIQEPFVRNIPPHHNFPPQPRVVVGRGHFTDSTPPHFPSQPRVVVGRGHFPAPQQQERERLFPRRVARPA